jgi:hypothetical protein
LRRTFPRVRVGRRVPALLSYLTADPPTIHLHAETWLAVYARRNPQAWRRRTQPLLLDRFVAMPPTTPLQRLCTRLLRHYPHARWVAPVDADQCLAGREPRVLRPFVGGDEHVEPRDVDAAVG